MNRSFIIPITLQNVQKNIILRKSIAKREQTTKMICKSSCHCPLLSNPLVLSSSFWRELFQRKWFENWANNFRCSIQSDSEKNKIKRNKWQTELKMKNLNTSFEFWGFRNEYIRSWLDENRRCNWTKSNFRNWLRAPKLTFTIYIKIISIGGHLSNMPNAKTNKLFIISHDSQFLFKRIQKNGKHPWWNGRKETKIWILISETRNERRQMRNKKWTKFNNHNNNE